MKIIKSELGWKGDQVENVPKEYDYEKIECYMQGVRDYIKYIKRGYTRPTHLASIDIRHNRISRDEGLKIIKENEGKRPPSLDLFLDFIGLTEAEFQEIAESHMISPYVHDKSVIVDGKKTTDFNKWNRNGKMGKEYAQQKLKNWKDRNS